MAEDLVTYPVTTEDGRTYQFKAPRGASQEELQNAAEKAEKAYFPGLPKLRELPGLEGGMKGDIEQTQKVTAPRINKPAQTEDDPGILSGYLGQMAGFGKGIVTALPNKLSEAYHGIKQIAGEIPGLRNYWGERTPEPVNAQDPYNVANQIITGTPLAGPAIESLESDKPNEAIGRGLAGANLAAVMGSPKARAVPRGIVRGFQEADYPTISARDLRYSAPAAIGGLLSLARGNSIWGGLLEGGLVGAGLKAIPPIVKSMAREIPEAVSKAPWLENFRGPKPIDAEFVDEPSAAPGPRPAEAVNFGPRQIGGLRGINAPEEPIITRPSFQGTQQSLPLPQRELAAPPIITPPPAPPKVNVGSPDFWQRLQQLDPSQLRMPDAPKTPAPPVKAPKSVRQQIDPVVGSIDTPLPERVPVRPPIASGATGSPAATSIPAGDKNIMDFVKNLSKKQAPVPDAVAPESAPVQLHRNCT